MFHFLSYLWQEPAAPADPMLVHSISFDLASWQVRKPAGLPCHPQEKQRVKRRVKRQRSDFFRNAIDRASISDAP